MLFHDTLTRNATRGRGQGQGAREGHNLMIITSFELVTQIADAIYFLQIYIFSWSLFQRDNLVGMLRRNKITSGNKFECENYSVYFNAMSHRSRQRRRGTVPEQELGTGIPTGHPPQPWLPQPSIVFPLAPLYVSFFNNQELEAALRFLNTYSGMECSSLNWTGRGAPPTFRLWRLCTLYFSFKTKFRVFT